MSVAGRGWSSKEASGKWAATAAHFPLAPRPQGGQLSGGQLSGTGQIIDHEIRPVPFTCRPTPGNRSGSLPDDTRAALRPRAVGPEGRKTPRPRPPIDQTASAASLARRHRWSQPVQQRRHLRIIFASSRPRSCITRRAFLAKTGEKPWERARCLAGQGPFVDFTVGEVSECPIVRSVLGSSIRA